MTDKELMDLGRTYGFNFLQELKKKNASGGEMVGAAAYLVSGILKYVNDMACNMDEVKDAFNQCLDIWTEEEPKIKGN